MMPLAKPRDLGAIATGFHVAPTTPAALAPIQKQPTARLALLQSLKIITEQKFIGGKRDWGKESACIFRIESPVHLNAVAPWHHGKTASCIRNC